ncbi:hypothetical protein P0F65_20850 [Sphingomonas sp. I4]
MSAETDRWTRRARPSFLYVMYVLLLGSLPMAVLAGCGPRWRRR